MSEQTEDFAPDTRPAWRRYIERYPATTAILGITILVFVAQGFFRSTPEGNSLMLWGAKINENILRGEYWRLITPIFFHISLIHIGVNMYSLYHAGPGTEFFYGWRSYLMLYFVSGLAGTALSFRLYPGPSIGAASAVFGVFIAQGVLIFRNRVFFGERTRKMIVSTLSFVMLNLAFSLLVPGMDRFSLIGGMAGGLVFSLWAGPVLAVVKQGEQHIIFNSTPSNRPLLAALSMTFIILLLALTTL